MTDLNTAHERKYRSRLYNIVEDDFATAVTARFWGHAILIVAMVVYDYA